MTQEQEQLRRAVDHRLSGLRADPFLAQKIMEKGEAPMKKKITLGLVLALSMALICAFALAENWEQVKDTLENGLSTHLDLTDGGHGQPISTPAAVARIDRCAFVPLYAPVTVYLYDQPALQITPAVAQIDYFYRLNFDENGWFVGAEFPAAPSASVMSPGPRQETQAARNGSDLLYDSEAPLSSYLLTQVLGFHAPDSLSCSGDQDTYSVIIESDPFTIAYNEEIHLDERGRIIETKEAVLTVPFYLRDLNGQLLGKDGKPLEGAYTDDAVMPSLLPLLGLYENGLATVPPTSTSLSQPTPLPDSISAALFDHAVEETVDWEKANISQHLAPLQIGVFNHINRQSEADLHWVEHFDSEAFYLKFNEAAFTQSDAFRSRDPQPVYSDEWFSIVKARDAYTGSYQFLPPIPTVHVEYGEEGYRVWLANAHVKLVYSGNVQYSQEAVQPASEGQIPDIDFTAEYKISEQLEANRFDVDDIVFTLPYPDASPIPSPETAYTPLYRQRYCPKCAKTTDWVEICTADSYTESYNRLSEPMTHQVNGQDCQYREVLAVKTDMCLTCGNLYVRDGRHLHAITHEDCGESSFVCPIAAYWAANADSNPDYKHAYSLALRSYPQLAQ